MKKKPIVVSMGEPSGISSEILIKAWKQRKKYDLHPFFLIDNFERVNSLKKTLGLNFNSILINDPAEVCKHFSTHLPIYNIGKKIFFELGTPNKVNSTFIIESIEKSFDFVLDKKAKGLLTLPVCKKTLKMSGFKFNGQTEFIGELSKKYSINDEEIMILSTTKPIDEGKNLIVGLVTTHMPLKKIFKILTKKKIEKKLEVFDNSLKTIWKINNPKIGITGLNPHSGEDGLIGFEEKKLIEPIVKKYTAKGMKISGPLSSDTCFFKNFRKNYDGILCLYHDQGLSPIKTLDFFNSINVTAGLSILRVSPDHGPAFNIAKKKSARINSIIASLKFLEKTIDD
tara:strand:- start:58 stop:1080 length:1023 start_codon:yes stop_codon:yes gene_type:complete